MIDYEGLVVVTAPSSEFPPPPDFSTITTIIMIKITTATPPIINFIFKFSHQYFLRTFLAEREN